MFDFTKGNRKRKFDIDITGFEYKKLSDCFGENGKDKIYQVSAIYINTKSKYGDSAVVAVNDDGFGYLVNLPSHLLETCKEYIENDDAVEAINNGNCGFKIYTYTSKNIKNKTLYSVEFVNI